MKHHRSWQSHRRSTNLMNKVRTTPKPPNRIFGSGFKGIIYSNKL